MSSEKGSESIQDFIMNFYLKLGRAKERIDTMGSSKKYKYVESPSINIFEQLYEDIESFVSNFYELCLKQMDVQLRQCEKTVSQLLDEEDKSRKRIIEMENSMKFEK